MVEDSEEVEVIVTEGNVLVGIGGGDLFDVPRVAKTLPGMDPVDSAAATASFAQAEPEPAMETRDIETGRPGPLRGIRRVLSSRWPLRVALGASGALIVAVIGAVSLKRSSLPPAGPENLQVAGLPPAAPVRETAARPAEIRVPAREIPMPAPQRSGRDRLLAIESALAAGRRSFARVELGRLLLDIDALPAPEREDTRAEAELLIARILQEAADETQRSPR